MINPGGQLHENAKNSIDLRHKLIHYSPKTMYSDEPHELEPKLRGKYPRTGLIAGGNGNSWWPVHALSAGGANWTIESVVAYADEFSERLGIVPNYQRMLFGKKAPAGDNR